MMACTSIAPMLAPLIGGQVLWFLGWRGHRFWIVLFTTVIAGVVAVAVVWIWLHR